MRLIEKTELTGTSGKIYSMNVYPAEMRFYDYDYMTRTSHIRSE